MANPADAGKTQTASEPLARALVLELEQALLPGRRILGEALAKAAKDREIALTPILTARFILQPSLAQGVRDLLAACGKPKLSADKMAAEIVELVHRGLKKTPQRPAAPIETLLAEAAKAKVQVGAATFLPEPLARELLEKLGLAESVALQVGAGPSPVRLLTEGWLKLLQAMKVPPGRAVALGTDAVACKAALVAGLRCVVIPDEATAHQDFSGADLVVEEDTGALHLKDLLALLSPCQFRRS